MADPNTTLAAKPRTRTPFRRVNRHSWTTATTPKSTSPPASAHGAHGSSTNRPIAVVAIWTATARADRQVVATRQHHRVRQLVPGPLRVAEGLGVASTFHIGKYARTFQIGKYDPRAGSPRQLGGVGTMGS